MIEALTVDAQSAIMLFIAIMAMYPTKKLIHVFLDNARYHHAVPVQQWLVARVIRTEGTVSSAWRGRRRF